MTQIISMFNHKGGVSKTTTTFNLGWMLAKLGKRVLMVDADPQCNLTGVALGLNRKVSRRVRQIPSGGLYEGLL